MKRYKIFKYSGILELIYSNWNLGFFFMYKQKEPCINDHRVWNPKLLTDSQITDTETSIFWMHMVASHSFSIFAASVYVKPVEKCELQ